MISEFKLNNENVFTEKAQVLKEKEELQAQSQSLETAIKQACKTIPELNISENAKATTKVKQLVVVVHVSKGTIDRVMFNFQMKILEL